jgi:hypothetical protein
VRLPDGLPDSRGINGKLFAGGGQADATAGALIQRLAKFILQLPQLPRDSRLRQMQRNGGPADVGMFGDGREGYKLVCGHWNVTIGWMDSLHPK